MLQKHSNEGSIEDAIKAYEQALAIQADDVVTLTKLGESLQNFGQPQKALKCLEQALNLDPDHAVARDIRATVLMEAGSARWSTRAEVFSGCREYPRMTGTRR